MADEHTPGPWVHGSGDDYYIRAESYPKTFPHRFKSDDLGDYLALVGNRTADFGEANARLIAAAPDLLEAATLLEVAEMAHAHCSECGGEDEPEACPECFPLFDDARIKRRLAIAKATGK